MTMAWNHGGNYGRNQDSVRTAAPAGLPSPLHRRPWTNSSQPPRPGSIVRKTLRPARSRCAPEVGWLPYAPWQRTDAIHGALGSA
jgi:hypothetical protein